MTRAWIFTLLAVTGVSLVSLVGAVLLIIREDVIRRSLLILISFSVGALLGDAVIHLLPELAEGPGGLSTGMSFLILAGIGAFFILEKVLHWHHAHIPTEDVIHPVAITNLVGDAVHNFVDGAIIAGSFLVSVPLGVTTTLAVALHEIPQEIGDLGILIHAGLAPRRALALNLLSAATAIAGGILTLLLSDVISDLARPMVAITAGAFLYIAGSDLIPELHRETKITTSLLQLAAIGAGVGVMALLLLAE